MLRDPIVPVEFEIDGRNSTQYIVMPYMELQLLERERKKGSAELLILSLLNDRPRHGYEVGDRRCEHARFAAVQLLAFIKHGPDGTDHKGERVFPEINEALGSQLRRFGFIRTSPESLTATLAANASPARTRASRHSQFLDWQLKKSNKSIARHLGH